MLLFTSIKHSCWISQSFDIVLRRSLTHRNFHSSITVQSSIKEYANLVNDKIPPNSQLKDILKSVWENEVITSVCPNLVIRLTSLRGEVSREIWKMKGRNPKDIQILAVGTVSTPEHLPRFHSFVESFFRTTSQYATQHVDESDFKIGYDLLSKGSYLARLSVLKLFNSHYNFPEDLLVLSAQNSAILNGGMRGLKDLADACVLNAKAKSQTHRFIQPDNSFATWWNIIERPEKQDSSRRQIRIVEAKQNNRLQISSEEVHQHYNLNGVAECESWYITPVGNPSGTRMTGPQLKSVLETILERNPNSIIILDVVYVRTLCVEDALELMSSITNDSKLLQNIIFVESFSKSHGLCGERLGIYFTINETLFSQLHSANITFSAGPGIYKDFQFQALGEVGVTHMKGIEDLHWFWQKERKGLYNFLMNKSRGLFLSEQTHIETQLDKPLGLYLLLKVEPGVDAQTVFINTGVLGVDTILLSGHYIRFAVGQITEPTYSQYA